MLEYNQLMVEQKYRVLVVEDVPAIAMRFKHVFDNWPQASDVVVCHTLHQAIDIITNSQVDLLLVDLNLPDGSGVEAIKCLDSTHDNAIAIVISALTQRRIVLEAIKAGAVGYLLKDDDSIDILDACERVLSGQSMMSGTIARMVIDMVKVEPAKNNKQSPLTAREEEVLRAIAHGYSYRQVATLLGLSEHTVPVHIRNIYRKLKVNSRTQAAYEARMIGILDD